MLRAYSFVELHSTGGHSTVIITETRILEYMRKYYGALTKPEGPTDEQLLQDFVTVHWATEIKPEDIPEYLRGDSHVDAD